MVLTQEVFSYTDFKIRWVQSDPGPIELRVGMPVNTFRPRPCNNPPERKIVQSNFASREQKHAIIFSA